MINKVIDFKCTHNNYDDITKIEDMDNIKFPEAYMKGEEMAKLSLKIKNISKSPICILPFCHTVEAECLGAIVNFGDAMYGPRINEYKTKNTKELEKLEPIDFTQGRIAQVILACKNLKDAGEFVCLEISGPMTILSSLIDLKEIFKTWRKNSENIIRVLEFINGQILKYADTAKDYADIICYADPIASYNILGPKMSEEWTKISTIPFLNKLSSTVSKSSIIHICPKISFMLTGLGLAKWQNFGIEKPMRFSEACIKNKGNIEMTGENCIKNKNYIVKKNIKEIILN